MSIQTRAVLSSSPFPHRCACHWWLKSTASSAGPYPYVGANVLKLYTDFQVFLVALVGLVMRMDSETLAQEQFGRDFYGNALLAVLVGTLVLVCYTVLVQSPVERAVAVLKKTAKDAFSQVELVPAEDTELVPTKTKSSSLDVRTKLREMFAHVDQDDSGQLNRAELILQLRKDKALRQLLNMPAKIHDTDREDFEKVFQGMDIDDDRAVSLEEFEQYITTYMSKSGVQDSRSIPDAQGTRSSLLLLADGSDLTQEDVDVVIVDDPSTSQLGVNKNAQKTAATREGANQRAHVGELALRPAVNLDAAGAGVAQANSGA